MTAVTAGLDRPDVAPVLGVKVGLVGTLRSELTKLRSVRSTYWTLILVVVAGLAWAVADCAGEAAHWATTPAVDRVGFDPTQASLAGLALLGQLIIVVLGALALTSEYSTGMIRTSLTVMPWRGVLYAAKAAALTAVIAVVAVTTSFAAFFTGQYLLRGTHVTASLSQPGVLRAVVATALYVVLSGLFAFGFGAILRGTAGAMTTAYGLLFLVPQLAKALPSAWYADVERWLPGGDVVNAITGTLAVNRNPSLFSAWGEFAVFGAYTAVLLIIGALLFSRRDA